jgi:uncharacterized protein YjbJ (UPF0337 family)
MSLRVMLRMTLAPPVTSRAGLPRANAVRASRLDDRIVRLRPRRWEWTGDEDGAGRGGEQALDNRADEDLLEVRASMRADDEEVSVHVLGELGQLARRTAESDVDSRRLVLESTERVHLFLDVKPETASSVVRLHRVRFAGDDVQDVHVTPRYPPGHSKRLFEREPAREAKVVSDDEREGRYACSVSAHGRPIPAEAVPGLPGLRPCNHTLRGEKPMGELIDKAKGKIKQAAGVLGGDKKLENEGKLDEAKGKVKGAVENVKHAVRDAVKK